jgi:alkylation response protein AidB-like acyl-CoA dehydrogenase
LIENPHFAARVAQVEINLTALATSNMRAIAAAGAGGAPGLEASFLKVKGSIIRQEINDLARRAVGPYAMPFASEGVEGANERVPDPFDAGPVAGDYFNNRKLSIFGGSNEIQRGIIAKTVLGGGR